MRRGKELEQLLLAPRRCDSTRLMRLRRTEASSGEYIDGVCMASLSCAACWSGVLHGEFGVDRREADGECGERAQRVAVVHHEHVAIEHAAELKHGVLDGRTGRSRTRVRHRANLNRKENEKENEEEEQDEQEREISIACAPPKEEPRCAWSSARELTSRKFLTLFSRTR